MAFRDFKDLASRITSGTVLPDQALNIAKNPNFDGLS